MFNFTKYFSNNANNDNISDISIKTIDGPLHSSKLHRLNLTDNLFKVRQELENNKIIDNTLLFSKKFHEINNENNKTYEFAEIALENEENYLLSKIIYENENILYLKQCSKPDWECLNELRKLDYGCTMTFDGIKKAENRAFVMKDCELITIGGEGYDKGIVEFKSSKDRMMKTNLFFSTDINVQNFVELGMSIGKMENNKTNSEINSSYHFIKYGKASLKFSEYLEPTQEFIEEVKEAIKSKDPKNFKQITDKFGLFIPTEVILGGRVQTGEQITSTGYSAENSKENAVNANVSGAKASIKNTSNYSEGNSNYYKYNSTKIIGGKQPEGIFDETSWAKSLLDYKNWDSIEFQKPISIFQLLPNKLHKQIIEAVGKRIHYSTIENFNYYLEEIGKPKVFELNIPSDVSKIVQNKDADCNIFATVIDTTESKNDFFTCQVLCPTNGKPNLIIHCIQKKFKQRQCNLKIRWMIIGYYTDFKFILSDFHAQFKILKQDFNMLNNQTMINTKLLSFEYNSFINIPPCLGISVLTELDSSNNSLVIGHHFYNAQEENKIGACTFSYCLKNNHYVNLPRFTFYTLIISNYHIRNAYNIIPFNCPLLKKPYIDFNNIVTGSCTNPKFISLYSTQKNNCGPIFLKQTNRQIEPKSIICRNRTCSICKNNTLKISDNNIKCAFFDPEK